MLTRKGPGAGAAATAGGGFGIVISFWQDGHFVCIPAHSGPQAMCCEQCGQENFNSLITQLASREHGGNLTEKKTAQQQGSY
jgi:hypothetical protein